MLLLLVVTVFRLGSVAEHKPVDQESCRLRNMTRESSNSHANVSEPICNLPRASSINDMATEASIHN
jgi:hypothetical protein